MNARLQRHYAGETDEGFETFTKPSTATPVWAGVRGGVPEGRWGTLPSLHLKQEGPACAGPPTQRQPHAERPTLRRGRNARVKRKGT